MKKYLLLLVLAISSVTCFAQQRQSVITTQEEQTEEEAEIISVLYQILEDSRKFKMDIQTCVRYIDEGVYFLDAYMYQGVGLVHEIDEFLDKYFPYQYNEGYHYVGGLTVEDVENRYFEYSRHEKELMNSMFTTIELYDTYFAPFNTEYAVFRAFLDELAGKVGDYSVDIQDNYNKAIESLKADFDTLFKEAEAAMYSLSMDDTYLERVSVLRAAEENLMLCAETATITEETINAAREIIESECPDVYEHYLSLLDKEEKEYDNLISRNPLENVIFDQEQTDSYINAMNESAAKVKTIVEEAKAAQERYKLCSEALAETTDEIDAIQTAVQNDCPDVWSDYTLDWNSLRSVLNNMAAGMGEAARNEDSTKGFLNALSTMLNQAKEISDKAHAAQQGVTGIDAVEADGNSNVEFYNLQGVKVSAPEAGMTLIKVDTATGKAQKVIIR